MPEELVIDLFDLALPGAASEWLAVNDGVMGGVSEGRFEITASKTLAFLGTVSLANNGGFASVRTRPKKLGLQPGDALRLRILGDGRPYSVNLYVPRPQVAFSYRATVRTQQDQWIEVTLPLDTFEATSFGRVVRNAGPVNPSEVNAMGLMISDKLAGPFKMEIETIRVIRPVK